MICPSCQRENPAQANFCMQCGAPLAASEPPERDPRVYTPAHLANKILTRGARGAEPQILEHRAELARLLGDEAGYQRELRQAQRLFVEMGATGHARRVAAQL